MIQAVWFAITKSSLHFWSVARLCFVILIPISLLPTTYVVIPPIKVKGSGPFYRIQESGKWGYMNRQGRVVIAPRFDRAEDFFEQTIRENVWDGSN